MIVGQIKEKDKDNDAENIFVGAKLYGEVQESYNKEDNEEWLGDSGELSNITYNKKDMTDVEK